MSDGLCPICESPMGETPELAYSVEGQQVRTCEPCREIFWVIMTEAKMGWRPKFWGRSNDPAKIKKRIRDAVLEERRMPT